MSSVYVQFRSEALPTLAEGQVYPLLKRKTDSLSDAEYVWAFAISDLPGNNNRLLAALLQAMGFKWDVNSEGSHHFLYDSNLIVRAIDKSEFTTASFPDASFSVDIGTNDELIVAPENELSNGDEIRFESGGGTLPAPLVAGVSYFSIDRNAGDFKLSASAGGGAITFTSDGTGYYERHDVNLIVRKPKQSSLELVADGEEISGQHDHPFQISFFQFVEGSVKFRLAPNLTTETDPSFELKLQVRRSVPELETEKSPGHPLKKWLKAKDLAGDVSSEMEIREKTKWSIKKLKERRE